MHASAESEVLALFALTFGFNFLPNCLLVAVSAVFAA